MVARNPVGEARVFFYKFSGFFYSSLTYMVFVSLHKILFHFLRTFLWRKECSSKLIHN